MSSIATYLNQILRSVYGKDVRQAIHDAISECYDDVNAPALQTEAMQAAVQAKIDAGEMAALTIADGSLTGVKLANGTITRDKLSSDIDMGLTVQEKALILSLARTSVYNSNASSAYSALADLWGIEQDTSRGLIHKWDLTQSLVDMVGAVVARASGATQGTTGVVFSAANQYLDFGAVYAADRTYELDIADMSSAFGQNNLRHRIFCADHDVNTANGAAGITHSVSTDAHPGWMVYPGNAWNDNMRLDNVGELTNYTYFSGRTVKVYVSPDNHWTIKSKPITGSEWTTHLTDAAVSPADWGRAGYDFHVVIGGTYDNCTGLTVSGMRVYEGEV